MTMQLKKQFKNQSQTGYMQSNEPQIAGEETGSWKMTKQFEKKQLKQIKNQSQSGRSMVEMLGVLAIVGVLSIGGIEGYRWAMDRYAANQIIHELNVNSAQLAMILQQHPTKKVTLSLGGTYDEEEPHLATIGYPFDYGCDDIFGPISPECTDVGAESYFMTVYKMNERVCRMVSEDVTRVSYYDALEVYNEDADEDLCESGSANNITVLFNINNTPGSGNGEGEEGEEGAVTSHHPATTVSGDDGDLSIPANCKKKGYVYVGGTGGFSNVVGRGIGCCNKVALSPAKGTNVLSGEEDICSLACENYNTESCCPYIWTGTVCCQVINDGAAGIDAEGNITEACSWGPSGCDGKGGSLSAQKPTHICCAHVFEDGEQATWTGGSDGECCIGGKNVSRGSFTEACCAEIGQSYVNGQCGKVSCDEILDENGSPKISGIDSARLYQCCIEKYGPAAMFDPNAGINGEGKCCRGAECHPTSTPWSTIITFTPGDISTIITPTPTARTTPEITLTPTTLTTFPPSTAPTTASSPTPMPTTTPLPSTPTPQTTVPPETTTTLTTPGLATMPESTTTIAPMIVTTQMPAETTSAAPGPTATKTVKSTSATPPPLLTPVTRPESTSQVSDIKPAPGITSKPQCEPWEMWDGQECICAPGFFGDECQQLVY